MMLSKSDIDQLVREPSVKMRGKIVTKVCNGFNEGSFNTTERSLAIEIFRLLLRDTEKQIRKIMAEELKENMHVPHDVIWGLAHDEIEIASLILENSYVLTEEDLITIIQATNEVPRLEAISRRSSISRAVSHELIGSGIESVVKSTLQNSGARIREDSLKYVLDHYRNEQGILDALVSYGNLPNNFAEKLFTLVSDQLQTQLTKRYRLPLRLADQTSRNAKDAAMLQFLSPWMSQRDLNELVNRMQKSKRLTHSVIIRSLCIGDLRFFETAIAKLTGVPVSNARMLMMDNGKLGFKAMYEKTHLPADFCDAVHVVYMAALEETEYGKYRYDDYGKRIKQRIIAQGKDSVENMNTLFSLLGQGNNKGDATIH